MDRAYCVSLQREVEINEVGELYRQGLIAGRGDFACLDPECRAGYVYVNLGKSTYKVSPHFKTAINSERGHVDGCAYEVECKNPVAIKVGREKRLRLSISDDAEILFESIRPKKYFTVPGKFNGVEICNKASKIHPKWVLRIEFRCFQSEVLFDRKSVEWAVAQQAQACTRWS